MTLTTTIMPQSQVNWISFIQIHELKLSEDNDKEKRTLRGYDETIMQRLESE